MIKPQYISYVQTKRITDWKRIVISKGKLTFIYGSKDSNIFANISRNSLLWIIESQPNRPPSLVAKLEIKAIKLLEDVIDTDFSKFRHYQEFTWVALCKETSIFFGYNNLENEILNLYFENSKGLKWRLSNQSSWHPDFGRKLQGPRRISISEYEKNPVLNNYIQNDKPSIFISWKWKDNSYEWIKNLAYKLSDAGYLIWLDILVFPKSRALKIIESDSKKLEKLLKYGYANSDYLLAIDSPDYGVKSSNSQKNWTLLEWQGKLVKKINLKKILIKSLHKKESKYFDEADFVIENNVIDSIIKEFIEIDKILGLTNAKNKAVRKAK